MKPLKIGTSACFFHNDPERKVFKGKTLLYLEQSMAHWIMSEGALVYLIPSTHKKHPIRTNHLVEELDGLVLQGGSDVCPKSYGEEPLKAEWNGDYVRDCYEIELLQEFIAQKKPVLGVCRGAQLINVAFGGSLYQDIQTQIPHAINHRNWEIYDKNFHEIDIEPSSGMAKLYPKTPRAKINSVHHQALKNIGKGLTVEARSDGDQIVEAVRGNVGSYVFAVQWHPEFQDPHDNSLLSSKPILNEFLDEVKKRK